MPEVFELSLRKTTSRLGELQRAQAQQSTPITERRSPLLETYLCPNYLAKNFSSKVRLECYSHHYASLSEIFSYEAISLLTTDGLRLLEYITDAHIYVCEIRPSSDNFREGEVLLTFRMDGFELYVLQFTIVPGHAVFAPDRSAILISRMQGCLERFSGVQAATKDLKDIFPQAISFAVLRGLAKAMAITQIIGVSARNQASFTDKNAAIFEKAYDYFFESVRARGPANGFYSFNDSNFSFEAASFCSRHRSRTEAKRKFKAEIATMAFQAGARYCFVSPEVMNVPKRPRQLGAFALSCTRQMTGAVGLLLRLQSSLNLLPSGPTAPSSDPQEALSIPAKLLATGVGRRSGPHIFTSETEGCLSYGPYISINAGTYRVKFEAQAAMNVSGLALDVVANIGSTTLARKKLAGDSLDKEAFLLEFSIMRDYYDVEFRVFVPAKTVMMLKGIKLEKLPSR